MNEIMKINSITELHNLCGIEKPVHPLVTIINLDDIQPKEVIERARVALGFYVISMKLNVEEGIYYGRQYYDFQEGSLIFSEPNQISEFDIVAPGEEAEGWIMCIHPEFIRGTNLANDIKKYSFFSYQANEALHVSDQEKKSLNMLVDTIRGEINQNMDVHTRTLIINTVELILNYSNRYYERQFITRTTYNNDLIQEFVEHLRMRFEDKSLERYGMPTVKELAETFGYSDYYLSDLLKKETGRSALDYIQDEIITRAKNMLMGSNLSISQIGYILGYEYPNHFSKFFKTKTGKTPSEYRKE